MIDPTATPAFLEHNGIRFARQATGPGEPLVLLHGLGGDRSGALELADDVVGWQRIAHDQRGHGDTEPVGPEASYDFGVFAADLLALLDDLGAGRAVVVGVSMGAGVALRFALDHPERTRALVLVRPAWIEVPLTENLAPYVEIAGSLRSMPTGEAIAAFQSSDQYKRVLSVSRHAGESLLSQFTRPKAVERAVRLDRMPRSVPFSDPAELSLLTRPTLVVGCPRDPLHPLDFAETWARLIPGASLELVSSSADDVLRHRREVRGAITGALRRLNATGG